MKECSISKIIFLGLLVFIFSGDNSFTVSAESLTTKENDEILNLVNLAEKKESEQLALIEAKIFELNHNSIKNKDPILLLRRKQKEIYDRIFQNKTTPVQELEMLDKKVEIALKMARGEVDGATGKMIRPVTGAVTVPYSRTSEHPVFGKVRPHNGTDFKAGFGEPIWAADGGEITFSGWMSGYGYTVIINHGNGLSTLYAHQNQAPPVSVGESVKQGKVIGYIGSTGYSTGPHLHFEIRLNGELQDPYDYVPYSDSEKEVKLASEELRVLAEQLAELKKDEEKNKYEILSVKNKEKEVYDRILVNRQFGEAQDAELEENSKQIEKLLKGIPKSTVTWQESMIRPTTGGVTSVFSTKRIHPVFGSLRPHNGTDFGGYYGEPIKAASGGEVIFSEWLGGLGYTVIVYHGDGLATVYAHQNEKPTVSVGQLVKQGEVIGYVGSTGYSTGPHLHFEVRLNGVLQDPYQYVPY